MRRFTAAVLVAGFVLPAQAEPLARSTAQFSIDRSQSISTSGSISTRPTTQALNNSREVGAANNGFKSYFRTEANVNNIKPVGPPAMNPTGQTQASPHKAADQPSNLVLASRSVSTSKNIGTRPATQALVSMNSRAVGSTIGSFSQAQGAVANLKTDGGSPNAPDKLDKKQLDDVRNAMSQAQADADKANAEAKASQARVHQAKEDIQQILDLMQEMQPCTHC